MELITGKPRRMIMGVARFWCKEEFAGVPGYGLDCVRHENQGIAP